MHDVYRSLSKSAVQYTFLNQVPTSLTEWTSPVVLRSRLFGAGLYAQDQWRVQRLALNLGVRYDTFNAAHARQRICRPRYLSASAIGQRYTTCRIGATSIRASVPRTIVFGDGKTAIKGSLGRYVVGIGVTISEANHPARTGGGQRHPDLERQLLSGRRSSSRQLRAGLRSAESRRRTANAGRSRTICSGHSS